MRTTLTLDDDLAMALNRAARESGRSFKEVVNDTLRRGLSHPSQPVTIDMPAPHSLGRPRIDLTRAHSLADMLDDQHLEEQRGRDPRS